jgi:hypothetical protein
VQRDGLAVLAQCLCDLRRTVLQVNAVLDLLNGEGIALLNGSGGNGAGQGQSRCEVCEGRHFDEPVGEPKRRSIAKGWLIEEMPTKPAGG